MEPKVVLTESSIYCEKCNRTMLANEFYGSNNLEKYPNGKLKQCKKCLTMFIDNFNPDTYLWILQECDVPYVPDEWTKLLQKYGRDKEKLTGATILGRYLSKMKLKQWRDYRWKDNQFLQEIADKRMTEAMMRQGYDSSQIAQAIATASIGLPDPDIVLTEPDIVSTAPNNSAPFGEYEDYFANQSGAAADDFVDDLTEEDKTYLRLKWGKTYKPEEWVKLEQLYEEMMSSYDIQGAGHIDTLKLVCKTSLKANQLLDIGDIEGAQKMIKMYDGLMKSGKFTAAQNKAESGEFVDSVGELIELCEKEGYIERFYIETPNDKVDLTLSDMQRYTKSLIEKETNLSIMVEKALRENAKEDQIKDENDDTIVDDIDFSLEDIEKEVISDKDFEDFEDFLDEEKLNEEEE